MPIKFIISLTACFFILNSNAQKRLVMPVSPSHFIADERTEKIKMVGINTGNKQLTEYPLQQNYHKLYLQQAPFSALRIADTTPPPAPTGLIATTSGIASVYLEFNASTDPESGISYYAFAIGTSPGSTNIRYWQSVGTNTITPSFSLSQLGISEGSVFYFSVYAVNGAGLQSPVVSSAPVSMNWQNYGDTSNNVVIQFAGSGFGTDGVTPIAGWSGTQIAMYSHFISRMLPIIKNIYGPPSRSHVITLVRNLYYSGSNIYFPGNNEIHKDDSFHPQLLTHEILHAWRDDVILAMDSNWNYHPKLSGFEESFAQGASYACMNRYSQLYPNDTVVPPSLYGSSMDWDYDFSNTHHLVTEDFWSDYGGMNLHWERYEMGAAAMRKMHIEDSMFYNKFNTAWYAYLNANHQATPTRSLMIDIIASVLPQVEGIESVQWLNMQKIFSCEIKPGKKTWVRTHHYPWSEYIIFQNVHHYETFANGSDWAYFDNASQSWMYYNLNGATGTGTLYNNSNVALRQKNYLIAGNPAGFGSQPMNFSTDIDVMPWPGGDTSHFILNLTQTGLYRLNSTFGTTSDTVYRVIGNALKNTAGIFGGIQNSRGGIIYIDHENYPALSPLNVVNGAYHGLRSWASMPNPLTGGIDSKPGKVTIRYTDSLGITYRTFRNIDYGSWSGNQAFLLNVNDMEQCAGFEIFSNNEDDDCDGIIDEVSSMTFSADLYIEGIYSGNGIMNSALFNSASGNPSHADSVSIELHSAQPPYAVLYQIRSIVNTDGRISVSIPSSFAEMNCYVVLKHRNSIETWSKEPVSFDRTILNYGFNN